MLILKNIVLFFLFFFISIILFSQNSKDSLLLGSSALYIEFNKIDSLNITSIEFLEYLTKKEKESPEINVSIYSKHFEYKYKNGLLKSKSWKYSGIDSMGIDHFEAKTIGFKTYSFVYEDYYVYERSGKLKRIDQNTPHLISDKFYIFKNIKVRDIIINGIPAKNFLLANFNDIYDIIIEVNKNKFLQFEIN